MKKSIILYTLLGIFVLTILIFLFLYKRSEHENIFEPLEIEFIKEGELQLKNGNEIIKKIDIELAITNQERNQGLMYRSSMKENQGMLFIFEDAKPQSFWMKNTRIPLDIIYIGADSTVLNIAKNVPPMTQEGIPQSNGPAKFVLEINGGMSDQWNIKERVTKISWKTMNQKQKDKDL